MRCLGFGGNSYRDLLRSRNFIIYVLTKIIFAISINHNAPINTKESSLISDFFQKKAPPKQGQEIFGL